MEWESDVQVGPIFEAHPAPTLCGSGYSPLVPSGGTNTKCYRGPKISASLQRAQKTVQCSIFKDCQLSAGGSSTFSVARLCDLEARRGT